LSIVVDKELSGSITKTGNTHLRRLLVEAVGTRQRPAGT